MSHSHLDILVMGAGPAGLSTAISAKVKNPDLNIKIIERSQSYNKIGCVVHKDSLELISKLGINKIKFINVDDNENGSIVSVNIMEFEKAMQNKAREIGIEIINDAVVDIDNTEDFINKVITRSSDTYSSNYYVDATGQSAVIPRHLGYRKNSGVELKAIYTHFYSNNNIDIIKRMAIKDGYLWVLPIPTSKKNVFKYQLMEVLKTGSETITHENLLKSLPDMKEWNFPEEIEFIDPCNIFKTYVRQYPSFIFNNEKSEGCNWKSIGDADTTYFDKIFSGINKGIKEGILFGESLAVDQCLFPDLPTKKSGLE